MQLEGSEFLPTTFYITVKNIFSKAPSFKWRKPMNPNFVPLFLFFFYVTFLLLTSRISSIWSACGNDPAYDISIDDGFTRPYSLNFYSCVSEIRSALPPFERHYDGNRDVVKTSKPVCKGAPKEEVFVTYAI